MAASLNQPTLASRGQVDVEGLLSRPHAVISTSQGLPYTVGLVNSRAHPSLPPPFDIDGFQRLDPEPLPPVAPF